MRTPAVGLEPTTSWLTVMRYYQLSYAGIFITARRRPTLTGGNPQLQSALRSLTSVFDMGTGVSFSLSPPHYYLVEWSDSFKTGFKVKVNITLNSIFSFWLSPRSISISPLRTSLHFHFWPIYLIISQGSYFLKEMGNLILRWASHLDAFSVYPFPT